MADLLDAVPLVATLERWRDLDREGKHAGGRPAMLNFRALLVVMLLTATEHAPMNLVEFANIFWRRLDFESRTLLGINGVKVTDDHAGEAEWWYKRTDRIEKALYALIDPDIKPRRLMNVAERRYQREFADAEISARNAVRLKWFCNQLLEMTLQALPDEVRCVWKGHVAVDRTKIPAVSKRGRKSWLRKERAKTPEPDSLLIDELADWYMHRPEDRYTGDPNDRDGTWGYAANILVMTQDQPDAERREYPLLAVGFQMTTPGEHDLPEATFEMLASLRDRGYPAGRITGDLEYFALQKPDRLALPVRALGYSPMTDYRTGDKEVKGKVVGNIGGAVQLEGKLYCPKIPKVLIEAMLNADHKSTEGRKLRDARLEQRVAWEVNIKEQPDESGAYKIACPAAGAGATLDCMLAHRLNNEKAAKNKARPLVTNPPAKHAQDRICTQNSVTVEPNEATRYLQEFRYGTREWRVRYGHDRSQIESYNSAIKDRAKEDIENTARRRRLGFAAAAVAVAFAMVSANLRLTVAYYKEEHERLASGKPRVRKTREFTKVTIDTYKPRLPHMAADGTITFPEHKPNKIEEAA